MKLDNHIANRFLNDSSFSAEMIETHIGRYELIKNGVDTPQVTGLVHLLSPDQNKTYYISKPVIDSLDLFDTTKALSIDGWMVFKELPSFKDTYILPLEDNACIRVWKDDKILWICHINFSFDKDPKKRKMGVGTAYWVMFWINLDTGELCGHFSHEDTKDIAPFIYALLCFIKLSDHDEIVVPAGSKHGTRKEGKLINSTKQPITIVNSRWNTTVRMIDSFPVRGHLRLQPYGEGNKLRKLIFIEPFTKNGYKRTYGTQQ